MYASWQVFHLHGINFSRGGEGNRTPVQTYSTEAFYMLIPPLFVGK